MIVETSKNNWGNVNKLNDAVALGVLILLTGLFVWASCNSVRHPFEDAAMLMRYAEHFAGGKGIVWNVGEAPVDGATDFLFMVAVAAVYKAGLSIEVSVLSLVILAHFGTVILIYLAMRKLQGAGIMAAFVTALYVALGAGLPIIVAYFGTPFFAFAIAATWVAAQRIMFSAKYSASAFLVFSLLGLVAGLIRPEGVLAVSFMLVAVCLLIPLREARRLIAICAGVFLLLGGMYFIWRWNYFGHPLPNPFYKKGGVGLEQLSSLEPSIKNSFALLYPFLPAFLLGFRDAASRRMLRAFAVPILGFVFMWTLLSDEMNFAGRFQYPVVVIGALSWFPLVRTLLENPKIRRPYALKGAQRFLLTTLMVFAIAILFVDRVRITVGLIQRASLKDGRYDMGVMLSRYADRDYTIATSEPGLLALYSKWRMVDTWGLNDQWIAHHGGVTEEYLDRRPPDIIMWHQLSYLKGSWGLQVATLKSYVKKHSYTLAAIYGPSSGTYTVHYYYVRTDLPESVEIINQIRAMNYYWYENGELCRNYATSAEQMQPSPTHRMGLNEEL